MITLWQTSAGEFYRRRCKNRAATHDERLYDNLMGDSSSLKRALAVATDAIRDAPEGCNICHHLYDHYIADESLQLDWKWSLKKERT